MENSIQKRKKKLVPKLDDTQKWRLVPKQTNLKLRIDLQYNLHKFHSKTTEKVVDYTEDYRQKLRNLVLAANQFESVCTNPEQYSDELLQYCPTLCSTLLSRTFSQLSNKVSNQIRQQFLADTKDFHPYPYGYDEDELLDEYGSKAKWENVKMPNVFTPSDEFLTIVKRIAFTPDIDNKYFFIGDVVRAVLRQPQEDGSVEELTIALFEETGKKFQDVELRLYSGFSIFFESAKGCSYTFSINFIQFDESQADFEDEEEENEDDIQFVSDNLQDPRRLEQFKLPPEEETSETEEETEEEETFCEDEDEDSEFIP